MFNHTYETTACSAYPLREIITALQKAKINGELKPVMTSKGLRLRDILYVSPYSRSIPPFHHPIEVEDARGKKFYAIDQRPNCSLTRDGDIKISQSSNFEFLNLRAALEWLWNNDYREDLQFLGQVPFRSYSRLVSENIVRRLGLPADAQQSIAALTGYYYQCLFMDQTTADEDVKLKMAVRTRNYLSIPVEVTLPLIETLPILGDLESYCEAVKSVIPNPRLNNLNPAFMISISSGVWFGPAAKEVVAVGLEYPPAFLAMVFTALNDRTMHGAQMTKLVDSIAKNNTATEFNTGMRSYLENTHDV